MSKKKDKKLYTRKLVPHCGKCGHPGFSLSTAMDGRPRFTCDKCGDTWTCGHDGGEYLEYAKRESCNRHSDCYVADAKAELNDFGVRRATHCYDEDCEDCIGR